MPTTLQFRRYDSANIANTTGAVGEILIDTDKDTVVVQDGSTAGGFALAKESTVGAAYGAANTAQTTAQNAYGQANTAQTTAQNAYGQANTAYGAANTAQTTGQNAYAQANAAYGQANTAYGAANTAQTTGQNAYGAANTAQTTAQDAYGQANTAYGAANTAQTTAQNAYGQANSAYGAANTAQTTGQNAYAQANAAYGQANLAYTAANNSNLLVGGTITGSLNVTQDINISGNIFLEGNTTFINVATYAVEDSLIYLASNNIINDIVDIGFIGSKNSGGAFLQTGLARDASDGKYKLFDGLPDNDHVGNIITFANSYLATLVANVEANTLTVVNGVSGNVNFDSGTLFVDALNNEVGVGTTTPEAALHIVGTTSVREIVERANVSATALGANLEISLINDGAVTYLSANSTANSTLNIRGNSTITLNTLMPTNRTLSVAVLVKNGATPYAINFVQLDGANTTINWSGGTAPTPNANAIDIYSFTILKTGSSAYTLLGAKQNFGA
jgi:hypothetical protein